MLSTTSIGDWDIHMGLLAGFWIFWKSRLRKASLLPGTKPGTPRFCQDCEETQRNFTNETKPVLPDIRQKDSKKALTIL